MKRPPREWWYRCTAGVEASGSAADPSSVCGSLWHHKMRASDKRLIVQKAEEKMNKNPVTLRIREGTRVQFRPTPASLALYSSPPTPGARGTVTSVSTGRGKRTSIPGPGGGLVYVRWDDGDFQGVSSLDLVKTPDQHGYGARVCAGPMCTKKVTGKSDYCRGCAPRLEANPSDGGGMVALVGIAAFGLAWLIFRKPAAAATATPPAAPPALPTPPPQVTPPASCPLDTQKLFYWGNEAGIQVVHLFGMKVMPDFTELKKSFPSVGGKVICVLNDNSFWRYEPNGLATPAPDMKDAYCAWAAKIPPTPPAAEPPPPAAAPAPTSAPNTFTP